MGATAAETRWLVRTCRAAAVGAVLALAAATIPRPAWAASTSVPGPTGPVDVEAGTVSYDATSERFLFEDGVRLRRGTVLLRARTASYDPKTGEVQATGDVLLTAPGRVVAADGIRAVMDGPWEAREVSAFYKSKPLDLDKAGSAAEAKREGRNRFSLWAEFAAGTVPVGGQPAPFTAEKVRLTLCDCGEGAPSWEIRAGKAEVTPGKSVVLSWPVIYVTPRFLFIDSPVPVLALPWLYVPLSSRQTGFLFPYFNVGSRTGFELGEPFFLTLGQSWDATISAAYAFGPGSSQVQGATSSVPPQDPGIRGPEAALELRWAPAAGVSGDLKFYYMYDALPYEWKPASGNRIALTLHNAAQLGNANFVNAEAALVGDAAYPQDFVTDLLLRNAPYMRSDVAVGHAFPDAVVEADLSYHLEIGTLGQPGVPLVPFGVFGGAVPSFHRLPAVSATLLPVRIAGPVELSGEVGLARFAPISGITDQSVYGIGPGEKLWPYKDGPTVPYPPPPGDAWTPGERLAASRAIARAELRAPFAIGSFLEVEPWVAGTAAGYLFDSGAQPALLDAWATGGAVISTRLERVYGSGEAALRHVIEPRVEWRGGSAVAGPGLPAYSYDEFDAAPVLPGAPTVSPASLGIAGSVNGGPLPIRTLASTIPGGYSQLRLALRNRVAGPGTGTPSATRLDIDLGQDFDLAAGRVGETWFFGGVGWGPVTGSVLARFYAFGATPPPGSWAPTNPSWLDHFTDARLDLAAVDARGDKIGVGFLALGSSASAIAKAGLDPMFDPRPIPFQAFAQATGTIKVHLLGGLDAQWDTLISVRSLVTFPAGVSNPYANPSTPPAASPPGFLQNTVSVSWTSPCECWRALVRVQVAQNGYYNVGGALDLSQITGFRISP
ncbi:MAG TPA: hypothetical protein VMT17_06560 [Anaeromyxobacteraceae bacterium]|nr:hypothetical protein [Anaeromyxobacteraceae bacterium]